MDTSKMDTSYLSQQVNSIINQLHGLFDEIGVPDHDRENREAELFAALSDTLNNQLRRVTAEKKDLIDEAQTIVTTIRQMESSLDDSRSRRDYHDDDELQITYPLNQCLLTLKEKHLQISRIHRERFEQVKKLVQALESYSSHLEPTFVRISLPYGSQPLDNEFTRVYEEYSRRVATVKTVCEQIIQLWAELGTPQAQTDGAIVKYYRDAPEQLGLHEEDIVRLRARKEKLSDEKKNRERRLKELKAAVEALWNKLGIDEGERKAFTNANRGCGVRQINEFQDELARLNELKHENLHLFVEDARCKLQELWDSLYLSEDEMLEFTPAFSDVYSDALLEAHEREIARLEALRAAGAHPRACRQAQEPRDGAEGASGGERRDPGKLLREEKMRKRIARELPKISADLRKALEKDPRQSLLVGRTGVNRARVDPEDVYDDGAAERYSRPASTHSYMQQQQQQQERPGSIRHLQSSNYPPAPPAARQISGTSHTSHTSTLVSGSENWETYDDNSEPEQDATDTYYAKVRAARIKRVEPESGHGPYSSQSKRPRGVPPSSHPHANHIMIDQDGNRIISASEWTDEDAF
ncbi:unnamed protein product [Parascedosporium putredinis]|uniref:Microtubule associated protein n=1 Tax=Parascedosporium putredinis TaxID=1442378 RepID=A0A9P1MEL6_9PEZI|nr:unnamed protein product [Parascedosporium putredinis]CAI8003016.1 unnamed protein product [Parascedosporium putredinis]